MSDPSTIFLLLALAGGSLFIVSLINQQQTRARLVNQKLSRMKRRVSELEDLSTTIETLVESEKVPQIVNDEAIDLLKNMLRVDADNAFFQISLDNAKVRAQDLQDPGSKAPMYRLMESDAAIARAHYVLNEAARIVRKRQASGHLQVAEMESLLNDLSWSDFTVRVISNVGQGHKALNRGDVMKAFAYYRKALDIASKGSHKDERQNHLISEIGEILNNKRRALSPRLMPETQYNPKNDAPRMSDAKLVQAASGNK